MQAKLLRNILITLLFFLGLGAIGGGLVLIISPNGTLMGMPLSILSYTPFRSFLLSRIILFSILGIAPLLLTIAHIKKLASELAELFNLFKAPHWAWSYTIYIAFALIIWIQIQMLLLNSVSWLHTFYVFLATTILFAALLPLLRNQYKK